MLHYFYTFHIFKIYFQCWQFVIFNYYYLENYSRIKCFFRFQGQIIRWKNTNRTYLITLFMFIKCIKLFWFVLIKSIMLNIHCTPALLYIWLKSFISWIRNKPSYPNYLFLTFRSRLNRIENFRYLQTIFIISRLSNRYTRNLFILL